VPRGLLHRFRLASLSGISFSRDVPLSEIRSCGFREDRGKKKTVTGSLSPSFYRDCAEVYHLPPQITEKGGRWVERREHKTTHR